MKKDFKDVKKLVIKIGSALLVDDKKFRQDWLSRLIEDVAILRKNNIDVAIVSSGSIALGKMMLLHQKVNSISQKQAAAALGQIELITKYRDIANKTGFNVAQILLTLSDCSIRERYNNLQNVFARLFESKIVPIINENDSIAVEEIKIGDNDRLAARVAQIISADMLILFSDIDGLYDKNPKLHQDAKFIPEVEKITADIEKMAKKPTSKVGTGGMITKITAAKMAEISGCDSVITSGIEDNCLSKLFYGEKKYTIFRSRNKSFKVRKKQLAGFLNSKGIAIVNEGAKKALIEENVSLLPIGVVKIVGSFKKGDLISIRDEDYNHIGIGIANYGSVTARKVIEKQSAKVREILGKNLKPELIHIDNLLVIA